jgi:8-oxo-dGTP pyrophosphatase MutT (NUDIX family)
MSAHLQAVREKVGHDLLTLAAASISVFDEQGRLLLAKNIETEFWMLPGGAIDPLEAPFDAAVRECFEETGLVVEPTKLIGVFGGGEFLVKYPNGDITNYTTIAFEARIVGGHHQPNGVEVASLKYFTEAECADLAIYPSSRTIAKHAFERSSSGYLAAPAWAKRS